MNGSATWLIQEWGQDGARTACPRDRGLKLICARTGLSALRFAPILPRTLGASICNSTTCGAGPFLLPSQKATDVLESAVGSAIFLPLCRGVRAQSDA